MPDSYKRQDEKHRNRKVDPTKMPNSESDCEIVTVNNQNDKKHGVDAKKMSVISKKTSVTIEARSKETSRFNEKTAPTGCKLNKTKHVTQASHQNPPLSTQLVGSLEERRRASSQISPDVLPLVPKSSGKSYWHELRASERATSGNSVKTGQTTPNSTLRVGQSALASSARVAPLSLNSSTEIGQLASTASSAESQFVHNSSNAVSYVPVRITQSMASSSKNTPQLLPTSSAHIIRMGSDSTANSEKFDGNSSKKVAQFHQMDKTRITQFAKLKPLAGNAPTNSNLAMVLPVSRVDSKIPENLKISASDKIRAVKEMRRQEEGTLQHDDTKCQNNLRLKNSSQSVDFAQQVDKGKYVSNAHKNISQELLENHPITNEKIMTKIYHVPWSERQLAEAKFIAVDEKAPVSVSQRTTVDPFCVHGGGALVIKKAVTKTSQDQLDSMYVKKKMKKAGSTCQRDETFASIDERIMDGCFEDEAPIEALRADKSTLVASRRQNVRPEVISNQKQVKLPARRVMRVRSTDALADFDRPMRSKLRVQCAICKESFTDNHELHRHVTLSHPGVRIVFCELCGCSFRTDDELEQHRSTIHKKTGIKNPEENINKMETVENKTTKMENISQRPRKSTRNLNERRSTSDQKLMNKKPSNLESNAGHSRAADNFRARITRKKVAGSSVRTRNFKKFSQPGSRLLVVKRGRPRTKNIVEKTTYNYVDVDVILHKTQATNRFKSAEIKKLVVELTRLEETTLDKHLEKSSNELPSFSPISTKTANNPRNETPAEQTNSDGTRKARKLQRKRAGGERNVAISQERKIAEPEFFGEKVLPFPRRSARCSNIPRKLYSEFDETSHDESTSTEANSLNGDEKSTTNAILIRDEKSREAEKINHEKKTLPRRRSATDQIGRTKKFSRFLKKQQIAKKLVTRSSMKSSTVSKKRLEKRDSSNSKETSGEDGKFQDSRFSPRKKSTSCGRKKTLLTDNMRSKMSRYLLRNSIAEKDTPTNSNVVKKCDDQLNKMRRKMNKSSAKETSYTKESNDEEQRFARRVDHGDEESMGDSDEKVKERKKSGNTKKAEQSRDDAEKLKNGKIRDEGSVDAEGKYTGTIADSENPRNDKFVPEKRDDASQTPDNDKKLSERKIDNNNEQRSNETNNGANKTRSKDENNDNDGDIRNFITDRVKNLTDQENLSGEDASRCEKLREASSSRTEPIKIVKQHCERSRHELTKSHDRCAVCDELFALMKEVSNDVDERKASGEPIKCPFCKRYFISMFHLELHVATNHLRCRNKVPCKKSMPANDGALPENNEPDREISLEVTTDCPKYTIKFHSKKDLIEHQHETLLSKETSSDRSPEDLKDSRTSRFETTDDNDDVITRESEEVSVSKSETKSGQSSALNCFLCDKKFLKSTEYVRHVTQVHGRSERSLSDRKSESKNCSNDDCMLYREDSCIEVSGTSADAEVSDFPPVKSDYKLMADLVSDPDDDGKNKIIVRRKRGRPRKVKKHAFKEPTRKHIVDKIESNTVIGFLSNYHTCNICRRQFRRAQDLLIHSMHHNTDDTSKSSSECPDNSREKASSYGREPFVEPIPDDETFSQDFAITEHVTSSSTVENTDNTENNTDIIDVHNDADSQNEKVVFGRKRQPTSPPNDSGKVTEIEENVVASKKRKTSSPERSESKSVDSPKHQSRNVTKDTMNELIEMEMDLNDVKNDKLPIACGKCNRHFATRSLLNEHLFFLHDDSLKDTVLTDVLTPIGSSRQFDESESPQNWHCEKCVQNFKLFQGYCRHRYFVHGDDSMVHVCENCSKVLTNVTMVNVHICTDMASYNCRTCNETFQTGMSLRLHNTEKHMETNGSHVCKPCDRNFLTNSMLKRHEKSEHRFTRPYRARKSSPVLMASPDAENREKFEETASPRIEENDDDEKEEVDTTTSFGTPNSRRNLWRSCRDKTRVKDRSRRKRKKVSANQVRGKRKRGRPRKYPLSDEGSSYDTSQDENEVDEDTEGSGISKESIFYIDETEIHQCSFCQIYCLSITALRNHMAQIHSVTDQTCQLCQKLYPAGKLIRHLMERHVTSDDGYVPSVCTSWKIGENSNDLDTDVFVKVLGIRRLESLCEYRRYAGKINMTSYQCSYCEKISPSNELYRYHLLLHHDTMCALCNIEFKKGQDAARHKGEIHGSVGRYIWFADRVVMALTATKNFSAVTDNFFAETLGNHAQNDDNAGEEIDNDLLQKGDEMKNDDRTKDSIGNNAGVVVGTLADEEGTEQEHKNPKEEIVKLPMTEIRRINNGEDTRSIEEDFDATDVVEAILDTEDSKTFDETPSKIATLQDENANSSHERVSRLTNEDETITKDNALTISEDRVDSEDVSLIIVVTDEDLLKFNINTQHPNIWGLAAKISSTCDETTPRQIKDVLECYFERQEDFDT